jgi:PAS domain S-box-containing protein
VDQRWRTGDGDRSAGARARLLELCATRADAIADHWLERVLALPLTDRTFRDRPIDEVRANVWRGLRAFRALLEDDDAGPLDAFVQRLADQRYRTGFSISAPLLACSQFRVAVAHELREGPAAEGGADDVDVLLAADALLLQFERGFAEAFAARSIAATEERYREMFEHADEGFATVDAEGRLTRMNARFEAIVGPRAAWLGRPLEGAVAPADEGVLRALIDAALRGEPATAPSLHSTSTDGAALVLSAHASRLTIEPGAFVILNDVTDEVARREQLVFGEKLASVGQVAASVAHDLNNPLAWVLANVEHLRSAIARLREPASRASSASATS